MFSKKEPRETGFSFFVFYHKLIVNQSTFFMKSIYVDANRVDEFAALAAQMPGEIRFEPSEQDSLTYIAAEKVYMKGEAAPAKESFTRYLQSYPGGAFSLNAHYYLCVIGKEQKDDEAVLEHAGKLLESPVTVFPIKP